MHHFRPIVDAIQVTVSPAISPANLLPGSGSLGLGGHTVKFFGKAREDTA
jgi:hypothetical protein